MLFNLSDYGAPILSVFSIFLFIPLSLVAFYLTNKKHRMLCLLVINAVFIFLCAPIHLITISSLILVNYLFAKEIFEVSITQKKYATLIMLFSVATNLAVWLFFSLSSSLRGYDYLIGGGVVPFLLIDTNLRLYRKKLDTVPTLVEYAAHSSFFPRLFVGPFNSINQHHQPLADGSFFINFKKGFLLISKGMFQFLFLGVRLIKLAEIIASFNIKDTTLPSVWLLGLSLILGGYHTLCGICTFCEGVCAFFGADLPSRWHPIFGNNSLISFSRGFHGSLEQLVWNVFNVKPKNDQYNFLFKILASVATGAILGLWVDFSLTFFILGAFVAICAVLEYYIFRYWLKTPSIWRRRIFLAAVFIAFLTLLVFGYSGWNVQVLRIMYGFRAVTTNYSAYNKIAYYFNAYLFLIVLGVVSSSNMLKKFNNYFLLHSPKIYSIILNIVYLFLFLLSITLVF